MCGEILAETAQYQPSRCRGRLRMPIGPPPRLVAFGQFRAIERNRVVGIGPRRNRYQRVDPAVRGVVETNGSLVGLAYCLCGEVPGDTAATTEEQQNVTTMSRISSMAKFSPASIPLNPESANATPPSPTSSRSSVHLHQNLTDPLTTALP